MLRITALLVLALLPLSRAAAAIPAEIQDAIRQLKTASDDERKIIFQKVLDGGDARLIPLLQAYTAGLLEMREGKLVIYQSRIEVEGSTEKLYPLIDAFTGETVTGADGKPVMVAELGAEMWKAPRPDRRAIAELVSALSLADPDPQKRKNAMIEAGDRADTTLLAVIKAQLERRPDGPLAQVQQETIARIELIHGERGQKLAAAKALLEIATIRSDSTLSKAMETAQEQKDAELVGILSQIQANLASRASWISFIQTTFAGLSLGSILILMALGLSITFGVMGVINMAHGEFMMVGAFSAYFVCEFFKNNLPAAWFDYYFIIAMPAAFLVAATAGVICERLVIRHLYGRPLETLLATAGIGLILIQTARRNFGDTNSLTPPSWLVGGWEVSPDLVLPLNRLFIIGFCVVCIIIVWFIVEKTKLGLLLRATTQNRAMASCLGVPTKRVDSMTFGLGAGLAGLAGLAVPLFDKINPQMGQGYIVDSFMVVVVGGVGKLMGTIIAGLGLGFLTKYIEPLIGGTGSVIYTKIIVLVLIIAILQKRPSGLFPARGRLADA